MSTRTLQQFDGRTIEEALGSATDALGGEIDILEAQRVRKGGVFGFFARERFEVTAAPRRIDGDDERFDEVLAAMVDRVDRAERRHEPGAVRWAEAEFVLPGGGHDGELVLHVAPDPILEELASRPAPRAGSGPAHPPPPLPSPPPAAPAPAAAPVAAPVPLAATVAVAEPASQATPGVGEITDAPVHQRRWSLEDLAAIGVPAGILDEVEQPLPTTDLAWVEALARAIARVLGRAAATPGRCELVGHGADAAVELLAAICAGLAPTAMIIDGARVPADPIELALAVRARLRRGQ